MFDAFLHAVTLSSHENVIAARGFPFDTIPAVAMLAEFRSTFRHPKTIVMRTQLDGVFFALPLES